MVTTCLLLVVGLAAGASGEAAATTQQAACDSKAVEQAARSYRIALYDTLHTQRGEYDRHLAQAQRVLQSWADAGQPEAYHQEVHDWFVSAHDALHAAAALPAQPTFLDELIALERPRPPATPVRRASSSLLRAGQIAGAEPFGDTGREQEKLESHDEPPAESGGVLHVLGRSLWNATLRPE